MINFKWLLESTLQCYIIIIFNLWNVHVHVHTVNAERHEVPPSFFFQTEHWNMPTVWNSCNVHIDALNLIFTQDFDDWDDVGLNTPHPPDLLHLYRDFSRHVIVKPETKDVGCGEDRIDEEDDEEEQPEAVEADLNMSIEQQRQHYVSGVE